MRLVHWSESYWGVFFASLTALLAGACLGCVELILRKVEVVDILPVNATLGGKFYVQGNYARSEEWHEKISSINEHSSHNLTLTEGDINMFIQSSFPVDTKQNPYLKGNVRIVGDRFNLGFILHSNALNNPLCIQFSGSFTKGPNGFYFSPRHAYIGWLPLPCFVAQPLSATILHRLFEGPSAASLVKGWQQLNSVDVANSTLRLSWK